MKNIFLIPLLLILLSNISLAEFRGNIVQTGVVNGIQTGDDGKLNSLGVNYDASGEAGTITLDKIEAGDLTEPVVIKTNSSSTSSKVLEIQDESGVTLVEVNADGSVKTAELQPLDLSSPNVMRLPSGSSAGDIVRWVDSSGVQRANISALGALNISFGLFDSYVASKIYYPRQAASDLQLRLLDDTAAIALQNSAGSDTFTFSLDGDDRVMSFIGGTNAGTLTWDDSAAAMEFSTGVQTVDGAGISIGGEAPDNNALDMKYSSSVTNPSAGIMRLAPYSSTDFAVLSSGGWANLRLLGLKATSIVGRSGTAAPSATYGINYPEQTAPSAPSSGGTLYFDSTAQELRFKDASGNEFTVDLTPVP